MHDQQTTILPAIDECIESIREAEQGLQSAIENGDREWEYFWTEQIETYKSFVRSHAAEENKK